MFPFSLYFAKIKSMAEISVCIPFYNAQEFIPKIHKMFLDQTDDDFECIFVDDGSTDSSSKICSDIAQKDNRFKLVKHEKNMGIGMGRISALLNATSDFVTFMDADDSIDCDAIEIIRKNISLSPDADLFVYDYDVMDQKGKVSHIENKYNNLNEHFKNSSHFVSRCWHKIFRKSIFEKFDISFIKNITFAEDLYICINFFLLSSSVVFVPERYYTYRYNSCSLIRNRNGKTIYENIDVLKNLLSNPLLKNNEAIQDYIKKDAFNCFGMLIYPNIMNEFQRSSPHFIEWLEIDDSFQLEIPEKTSAFCRFYINQIRKRHYIISSLMWKCLRFKRYLKFIIAKKN